MKDIFEGFDIFARAFLPFVLGFGACLARQAHHGWKGVRTFIRELTTCCFMGIVVFWGLDYYDLPQTVDAAITSGGAYAGMVLLDAITARCISIVREFNVPWTPGHPRGHSDNVKTGDDDHGY